MARRVVDSDLDLATHQHTARLCSHLPMRNLGTAAHGMRLPSCSSLSGSTLPGAPAMLCTARM